MAHVTLTAGTFGKVKEVTMLVIPISQNHQDISSCDFDHANYQVLVLLKGEFLLQADDVLLLVDNERPTMGSKLEVPGKAIMGMNLWCWFSMIEHITLVTISRTTNQVSTVKPII